MPAADLVPGPPPPFDEGRLRRALAAPLPGVAAHVRLAPQPRTGWSPGEIPAERRDGAGLLAVCFAPPEPTLLLTVRAADLPQHAGQVSLPGGRVEPGESLEAAALREAEEEVGLDPRSATVVGALTPIHIPVSGFVLHPFVAVVPERPSYRPAPGEVARVLDVPIAELADVRRLRLEHWEFRGRQYRVPLFDVAGEKVWGATAMILAEFLWAIGAPPPLLEGLDPTAWD